MKTTKNKHGHEEERSERGGIIVASLVLLILLGLIGFLIFNILQVRDAANEAAPVPEATPAVTAQPTPEPSPEPTPEPSPEPTPEPTPEPSPEPTPEPTPDPARFIRIATSKLITITKQPFAETVVVDGNAMFVCYANNASSIEWRFVSPDYTREILWNDPAIRKEFPGLNCKDGDKSVFNVYAIPKALNGWYAVCLLTDSDGSMLASAGAKITVTDTPPWFPPAPTPDPTPKPSPEIVEVTIPGETPEPTPTPEDPTPTPEDPTPTPEDPTPTPGTSPDPGTGNEGGDTGGDNGGTG